MRRAWLVSLIIAVNVVVFVLWQSDDPRQLAFMEDNFAVSWDALAAGRYWTLLTSVFSHSLLLHILINMFVLRSFGSLIEEVLGPWRFIKFYFAAGILGSLVHAIVSNYYLHTPDQAAVGASGAIAGLVVLFSLMFPREKILLFAIVPVPAMLGVIALVGLDLWGLTAQAGGGGLPLGHGAHLGGAAMGFLYFFFALPKGRRRFQ
jgi:rhomboid-like protein